MVVDARRLSRCAPTGGTSQSSYNPSGGVAIRTACGNCV